MCKIGSPLLSFLLCSLCTPLQVLPFAPDAWIDEKKSKVGYEIPFTRYFYKYEAPRPSAEIMTEIMDLEIELSGSLEEVFDL